MANGDEATERLTRIAEDSCRAVLDRAVGLQERNVRFAQGLVEDSIRELRRQSERNWEVVQELFERAEEQSDAFRTLVEESADAYMNFLCLPFSYHKEGLETAR